ncbi:uncharacterized protein B0H18DRAFT_28180 [Fomitopsis serialis]|uniref:uncharacterized protein n=1 Tax=Fomitopsis serialis TaxID=139415 RepID=UPI0020072BB8|nr:uncharacterized protein B0H18DRAFT_28180 [Neoantrodia serialis]KAH9932525.1 hypothetical protein B0H18DRAFT_28180 [Neoantrodia serialis]
MGRFTSIASLSVVISFDVTFQASISLGYERPLRHAKHTRFHWCTGRPCRRLCGRDTSYTDSGLVVGLRNDLAIAWEDCKHLTCQRAQRRCAHPGCAGRNDSSAGVMNGGQSPYPGPLPA